VHACNSDEAIAQGEGRGKIRAMRKHAEPKERLGAARGGGRGPEATDRTFTDEEAPENCVKKRAAAPFIPATFDCAPSVEERRPTARLRVPLVPRPRPALPPRKRRRIARANVRPALFPLAPPPGTGTRPPSPRKQMSARDPIARSLARSHARTHARTHARARAPLRRERDTRARASLPRCSASLGPAKPRSHSLAPFAPRSPARASGGSQG
jgi:hypothetical protein